MDTVGVSILTNGQRLEHLQACVYSLLSHCYYRPLKIGIFDNGSTDGTHSWCMNQLPKVYGVEFKIQRVEQDMGCAAGQNRAAGLVRDCKYVLHLESDFRALPENLSGCDKFWLHRAIEFMDSGECDFLYLRRMMSEYDIGQHWWSQWFNKIGRVQGPYMECPDFWWSNNPHLRNNQAIYDAGCLPLDEKKDGGKGTGNWSRPEMTTAKPRKPWIHKWGIFVHDAMPNLGLEQLTGCGKCKYGFFMVPDSPFCKKCDLLLDYTDMHAHYERFIG